MSRNTVNKNAKEIVVDGVRFTQVPERSSGVVCSFFFCLLNATYGLNIDYGYYKGSVESSVEGGLTCCIPCIFLISCGEKTYRHSYNGHQTPEKLVKVSDNVADQQNYLNTVPLINRIETDLCTICCCPVAASVAIKQSLFSRQRDVFAVGAVLPQSHEPIISATMK